MLLCLALYTEENSLGCISILGPRSLLKSHKDRCHGGHVEVSTLILALRIPSVRTPM